MILWGRSCMLQLLSTLSHPILHGFLVVLLLWLSEICGILLFCHYTVVSKWVWISVLFSVCWRLPSKASSWIQSHYLLGSSLMAQMDNRCDWCRCLSHLLYIWIWVVYRMWIQLTCIWLLILICCLCWMLGGILLLGPLLWISWVVVVMRSVHFSVVVFLYCVWHILGSLCSAGVLISSFLSSSICFWGNHRSFWIHCGLICCVPKLADSLWGFLVLLLVCIGVHCQQVFISVCCFPWCKCFDQDSFLSTAFWAVLCMGYSLVTLLTSRPSWDCNFNVYLYWICML